MIGRNRNRHRRPPTNEVWHVHGQVVHGPCRVVARSQVDLELAVPCPDVAGGIGYVLARRRDCYPTRVAAQVVAKEVEE